MTTKVTPDRWTTVLTWKISSRYDAVFVGTGSMVQPDRNTRRLDKLEQDPYGTLQEWHQRDTDNPRYRLRRHVEDEDPGEAHGRFEDEDGREVGGRVRTVAFDAQHKDILNVFEDYTATELTGRHGRLTPFREPGLSPDRVLAIQFRPHSDAQIDRPHVSLPVTVVDRQADKIRSTTATWDASSP